MAWYWAAVTRHNISLLPCRRPTLARGKRKSGAHREAVNPLDLLLQDLVDEPMLLDLWDPDKRWTRHIDCVERSTAACISTHDTIVERANKRTIVCQPFVSLRLGGREKERTRGVFDITDVRLESVDELVPDLGLVGGVWAGGRSGGVEGRTGKVDRAERRSSWARDWERSDYSERSSDGAGESETGHDNLKLGGGLEGTRAKGVGELRNLFPFLVCSWRRAACLPIDMYNPTDHLPQHLPPSSGFLSSCLSLAGILVALWALYTFGLVHSRHQAERLVVPVRPPAPGTSSNETSGISERTSLLNAVAQIHGGNLKHALEWNPLARVYLFGSSSFLVGDLKTWALSWYCVHRIQLSQSSW
jgi:hypothetical protein